MAIKQVSYGCPVCGGLTLHQKELFSGGFGCLLTIITGGLFLPIWFLIAIADESKPFRCQQCGAPNASDTFLLRAVGLGLLGLLLLCATLIVFGARPGKSAPSAATVPAGHEIAADRPMMPAIRTNTDFLTYLRPGMTMAEVESILGGSGNKIVAVGERAIYQYLAPSQQRIQCAFENGRLVDFAEGDLQIRRRGRN